MHWNKHVWSLFLHFIWFNENSRRRRLKKIMKKSLWLHSTLPLMPFCFSLFLTSFREKYNDVHKNQDRMLIPGQPCIVVWRHVKIHVPSWGFLSKNHVQTVRESHDSYMVLVVWKRLLVDLTMASNSCVHRYLCKNLSLTHCDKSVSAVTPLNTASESINVISRTNRWFHLATRRRNNIISSTLH